MPMKKFEVQPGNEIRGMRIRLYPDLETEEALHILEDDTRRAWNWLVKQTEEVLDARKAHAVRKGVVPPRPERPDYNGLDPEQSKAAKESYYDACRTWNKAIYEATNKIPGCEFRKLKDLIEHFGLKHDYQLMSRVIAWAYEGREEERKVKPGAHLLQSLVKNYHTKGANQRRKKFRRRDDPMPLQVRSGVCFELGDFGTRRGNPFYNCRVTFNGLKIQGRLPGRTPEGRILEGVSIRKEADGWWASIKQEVPIRVPPKAVPGSTIGIDVGLDFIAAFSDGTRIENERGKAYSERIAGRQAQKLPVGRLQQAAARHTRHTIYNAIVKPLATVETIKVERLNGRIGQMGGSSKTSAMRTAFNLLRERYGDRVREVEPHFTSQECSQCGFRSKESWSYEHGRFGQCPKCGFRCDRDVNAARNIERKEPLPLVSGDGCESTRCSSISATDQR
jgi:transposase